MRQHAVVRAITSAFVGLTIAVAVAAQTVPTGFQVETVVSSGLTSPNDFCFLPDGRILIANRPGSVTIYANGATATVGTVPSVEVGSERALLSIAADPAFPSNGYIYVWYASTADAYMHLERFTCTGDLGNPSSTNVSFAASSRCVVLANVPDSAGNHNGGSTRFGPDGMLYQSIGDDAGGCSAQSLASLQGVILRLTTSNLPAGASTTQMPDALLDPGDNPLSNANDHSRLVIAYGLRNPVRMAIDPNTNDLYIGDVGQNAHEEYDRYVYQQGNLQLVNFGWPWFEGNFNYTSCTGTAPSGVVAPLADIPQTQGWRSVMGGPRYRNRNAAFDFGPAYEGSAFYTDYFAGQIRRLVENNGVFSPAPAVPGQPSASDWASGFTAVTTTEVGPDGALYVLQHPSTYATSGGTLKRVRPLGPVNDCVVVSGDHQACPAGEPFAQPLVVRVVDSQNQPIPGGTVNFNITGPGTLSTANPVIADANGLAQTTVTATLTGGAISVVATTPNGSPTGALLSLFSRKLTVISTPTLMVLTVGNTSTAVPAQVPFVVLCSLPGAPPLLTPIGPLCTNPLAGLTFAIEDSIGVFGFASLSGSGAIGTPGLTKVYNLPTSVLRGLTLQFQAIGWDPVSGPFRSNCETKAF